MFDIHCYFVQVDPPASVAGVIEVINFFPLGQAISLFDFDEYLTSDQSFQSHESDFFSRRNFCRCGRHPVMNPVQWRFDPCLACVSGGAAFEIGSLWWSGKSFMD